MVDKSIIHLIKVLPDGINLATNESLPIRDKSSCFIHSVFVTCPEFQQWQ